VIETDDAMMTRKSQEETIPCLPANKASAAGKPKNSAMIFQWRTAKLLILRQELNPATP